MGKLFGKVLGSSVGAPVSCAVAQKDSKTSSPARVRDVGYARAEHGSDRKGLAEGGRLAPACAARRVHPPRGPDHRVDPLRVLRREHRVRRLRPAELPDGRERVLRRRDVRRLRGPRELRDRARGYLHEPARRQRDGYGGRGPRVLRGRKLPRSVPAVLRPRHDLVLGRVQRRRARDGLHVPAPGRERHGERLRLLRGGVPRHDLLRAGRMAGAGDPVPLPGARLRPEPGRVRVRARASYTPTEQFCQATQCCAWQDGCTCRASGCYTYETKVETCSVAAVACPTGQVQVASCSIAGGG